MLKIGEFSKLSQMTVKVLRFYEKEGLLIPASVDAWTGYLFYKTEQLETAAKNKILPPAGLINRRNQGNFQREKRAQNPGRKSRGSSKTAEGNRCSSFNH
ncbi:MAG: MerR family DNA-binding transcriptional regulator [Treponema sp.]|nr:MerR family DNA-binding transcriptional regulator [Candidatus Treponema scatequi]